MHPVFRMKNSSSAWTERVLVVTPTAPRVAQAYQARTISGQLSAWMRILSPFPTPAGGHSGGQASGLGPELGVGPASDGPVTGLPDEQGLVRLRLGPRPQEPRNVLACELELRCPLLIHSLSILRGRTGPTGWGKWVAPTLAMSLPRRPTHWCNHPAVGDPAASRGVLAPSHQR